MRQMTMFKEDARKLETNKKMEIKERIANYGVESLLPYELISLVTGIKTLDLQNFKTYADLRKNVSKLNITDLQMQKLEAIFSLNAQLNQETAEEKFNVDSPKSIYNYLKTDLEFKEKEYFKIVYLDTKNNILGNEILSIGTVNASLVDPRETLIRALENKAVNIIVAHNHPSSNPEPSREDILVTKRLADAAKLIGINLLDHIVVGGGANNYTSLKEKGYI